MYVQKPVSPAEKGKMTMKKKILNKVAKIAYNQAEKEMNKACPYFHNQPKVPSKVYALRKVNK